MSTESERLAKIRQADVFATVLAAIKTEGARDAYRLALAAEGKALNLSSADIKEIMDLTEDILVQIEEGASS
jgi:hypothetical protein